MSYVTLITTDQKPIVDIQKTKKKDSKHTTTENHQIPKQERKK